LLRSAIPSNRPGGGITFRCRPATIFEDRAVTDTEAQIFLSQAEREALAESDDDASAVVTADDDIASQTDDAGQEEVYQPLLVAKQIPQAGAALAALDAKESDLQTQFDEGSITSGEMAAGLREIQKHRSEIEWALKKNDLANEMASQADDARWYRAVEAFMNNEGASIKNSDLHKKLFDGHVRKVTSDASNANLSFKAQLNKAFGLYRAELDAAGFGNVSFDRDTRGGNAAFARLDKLAETNPARFEKAFAALSPSDQAAFLES
jgi:hypothetical protein